MKCKIDCAVNCDTMPLKKLFALVQKQSTFLFDIQKLGFVTNAMVASLMSYERYVAVCRPFEYQVILSKRRRLINYTSMIVLLLMAAALFVSESTFVQRSQVGRLNILNNLHLINFKLITCTKTASRFNQALISKLHPGSSRQL